MQHIGILAHSPDGSALCYLEIVREAARVCGPHVHPEITLSLLPMGPVLPAWEAGDLATVNLWLEKTAGRLAAAGCDFFVCPDNTAHIALETRDGDLPLPGLHIAEVVAARARSEGRRRVGLLGTRWTMEADIYPQAFERAGLACVTPPADARERVHAVIFDELCQGVVTDASRDAYLRIIGQLAEEGCDAIALCCTEIPLLISPEISPLPVLDSTRLLARAAVATALGEGPLPTWRGGRPGGHDAP